ncbi:regulating synaptic membrane exocytosis protein 1 [Lutzomyia longipalpis]|uniref:regulating synaptic membrane exocytosis protein 1 n=1 Tax=Lutzomyia longipalpis TaxID=7200 RepID=UPI0024833BD2|nr:regulating synaptic membrane exocytosis protein 1 [Lutzomyia longipalpis]
MLPTNVMSFMKKMVAADEAQTQSAQESTGTFGKFKQTLSTSLLTAQDKVHKMSPRPSLVPEPDPQPAPAPAEPQHAQGAEKGDPSKPPQRSGACRVCLKSFKPDEFSKTCCECQQRVCEDCASYSKTEEDKDVRTWRCSVCRRKMSSRVCIPQDSTDSMLEVPILEVLVRRHSDAKLGSTTTLGPENGLGLAPPRSPELRRHSDVSPASLKELEKLKGSKTPNRDNEWRRGRSVAPSRSSSPPRRDSQFDIPPSKLNSRRASRVPVRQHSYDDDVKNSSMGNVSTIDPGLGIPSPMPRRASAYDVFAPGILAQAAQVATKNVPPDRISSRRSSFRVPPPDELTQSDSIQSPDKGGATLGIDDSERRTRRRGSQLPDISALQNRSANPMVIPPPSYQTPTLEDLEAPRRQTSLDGEAIKIVIHDVDSGQGCASKRRVVLRRDPSDKAHRTRGFGMRVVGGKTGADGRLFAYIVWTVPGGPAEKAGLLQGDKILEWNGYSLIDRSFEEVCAVMDRTEDVVDLLVEHATDYRICDLLEDGARDVGVSQTATSKASTEVSLGLIPDNESTDKSPSSPTRRKLPKTPEQIMRESQVSGRVQLQVWYHGERKELVVSLMAADDLAPRDEFSGFGCLPEAYAKVRILPRTSDGYIAQTEVSAPTHNPIWNATLTFSSITEKELTGRVLEIALWDFIPYSESVFLGECSVDIEKAFLEDRAIWYRLQDPKQIRASMYGSTTSINRSAFASPRGSICGDLQRLHHRSVHSSRDSIKRSVSEDVDYMGGSFLHPNHAWMPGSRRGSSQSETLEVEVYQLVKDFSKSLPGSRRSSFQDRDGNPLPDSEHHASHGHLRSSRRSSSVHHYDPDELFADGRSVRYTVDKYGASKNIKQSRMYFDRSK